MSEKIAGRIPVLEALRANKRKPKRLFLLRGARGLDDIEAAAGTIETAYRSRAELDKLSGGVNHQGAILEADPLPILRLDEWLESLGPSPVAVVLDSIEDPHNFGAIVRTAAGFRVGGVIFAKDRSAPISTAMVKSAAGGVEHIDLIRVTNITRAIKELQDADFWVTGLAGESGQTIWDIDWKGPTALVIGSEGKGMRRLVRESCDALASIPMTGPINSFNASVTTGIALAECQRQRRV